MKKIFSIALVALLSVLFFHSGAVFAQISTYDSAFQVQNLSDSTATIAITFYDQTGAVHATVNDTITPNGSNTYAPLPAAVQSGFDGSVVISSDQPVAAIANVIGDGTQGASYSGLDGGAPSVALPIIARDFFGINTWFNVQNTGASATSVTISYSGKPSCNQTATIQPGAAATFEQETHSCLGSGYNGAATVSAPGGEVAATALQVAGSGLYAYNGFSGGGSTSPVMPLITSNFFKIHTGIQVQNTGTQSTNVTITYTPSGSIGTQCTETATIPAGSPATFTINAFSFGPSANTTCTFKQAFVGSAQVTGNSTSQPLVAIVNQTNTTSFGSAYNAFDPTTATGKAVMPLIMNDFGIFTGYSIVNVGTSATVTCTYSGLDASHNKVATLASGQPMDVQTNNANGFPKYIGSGTCTATSGGALLGVVNQASSAKGDNVLTYEAFNQ